MEKGRSRRSAPFSRAMTRSSGLLAGRLPRARLTGRGLAAAWPPGAAGALRRGGGRGGRGLRRRTGGFRLGRFGLAGPRRGRLARRRRGRRAGGAGSGGGGGHAVGGVAEHSPNRLG